MRPLQDGIDRGMGDAQGPADPMGSLAAGTAHGTDARAAMGSAGAAFQSCRSALAVAPLSHGGPADAERWAHFGLRIARLPETPEASESAPAQPGRSVASLSSGPVPDGGSHESFTFFQRSARSIRSARTNGPRGYSPEAGIVHPAVADVLVMHSDETVAVIPMLAGDGHMVFEAYSSGEMLQEVMRRQLDVLVIPDNQETVEGVELLAVLRRMTSAGIVMVGEGQADHIASALLLGADTYLTVPVHPRELRGRLLGLLRLGRGKNAPGVENAKFQLLQEQPGENPSAMLSEVEARLFKALFERQGAVVAANRLAADVWGDGRKQGSLRFYIRRLRSKLMLKGLFRIDTQMGAGYRLAFSGAEAGGE